MTRLVFAVSLGVLAANGALARVPVTALAFNPEGQILASAGQRVITLHDVSRTNRSTSVSTDLAKITSLGFHPQGRWLAAAGGSPGVRGGALLVNLTNQQTIARFSEGSDLANALAIDASGRRLAIAFGEAVRVYQLTNATPEFAFQLTGHSSAVLAVAFSPDESLLVTGGRDRSVKVWSAADGRLQRSLSHHTESVHALAFRPRHDGIPLTCATGGDDRTVRIWQPGIGRMVRIIRHHQGMILALGYSRDGQVLYSAGSEGVVRRIDAESDQILGDWRASPDWIYSLAVSPDGQGLAVGDWTGAVNLWGSDGTHLRCWARSGTD